MSSQQLAALYNAAPNILWVEDLLTSTYLDAIWQHDRLVKMYVGGGHETLEAVVEDARRSGHPRVFALRDRDFGPTNRHRWSEPSLRLFVLDSFEVECFLLDPPALAACRVNTSSHDEAWILEHLREQAAGQLWWMACRKVIAELRESRQRYFPSHPTPGQVTCREQAERVLLDSDWVKKTAPGLGPRVREHQIHEDLATAHAWYRERLRLGDGWMREFSGKELLNDLLTRLYTKGRPRGTAAVLDLAKAVAEQQRSIGRVPDELAELRRTIRSRPAA